MDINIREKNIYGEREREEGEAENKLYRKAGSWCFTCGMQRLWFYLILKCKLFGNILIFINAISINIQ